MKIKTFEDLDVWQASLKLSIELYKLLKNCNYYSLKDQIQRSATSIPSNIAEGFERTNKEFIHFLQIAKGSCSELQTQLFIAKEIHIIEETTANELISRSKHISAMLQNLITYRRSINN
jgi:four helix bundle protein